MPTKSANAGVMAVIMVSLSTVNVVGRTCVLTSLVKSTSVAPVKAVPVMVTVVPPVLGPELGLTPLTVGAGGGV